MSDGTPRGVATAMVLVASAAHAVVGGTTYAVASPKTYYQMECDLSWDAHHHHHGCGGFPTREACEAAGRAGRKDKSMVSYECYEMECDGCEQYLTKTDQGGVRTSK